MPYSCGRYSAAKKQHSMKNVSGQFEPRGLLNDRLSSIEPIRCALAPLTMLSVKETQRRVRTAEEAIDFDDVLARIYGSADFAEGVQAYLEKREPHWRGE